MFRAVILLGGPSKKASYGPYDQPSPLFPIAGLDAITHPLFSLSRHPSLKEIVLLGYYDQAQFKPII